MKTLLVGVVKKMVNACLFSDPLQANWQLPPIQFLNPLTSPRLEIRTRHVLSTSLLTFNKWNRNVLWFIVKIHLIEDSCSADVFPGQAPEKTLNVYLTLLSAAPCAQKRRRAEGMEEEHHPRVREPRDPDAREQGEGRRVVVVTKPSEA